MSSQAMVVLSTAPDQAVGSRLAAALLEAGLVACVNLVDGVRSLYVWDGKICDESEVLLICKTDETRVEALTAALEELHPYDCPEVVALPIAGGSAAYLEWVRTSVGAPDAS